ncbi:CR1-alpha [Simian adenovirus 16]|uniref:CR1-alpha n=1 Tax=Simian adenovirus 16 TaxID=1715778 RepID=A0A0M3TH13_9ADEN|nr:CR1-alpha [Simian adenovirus 16]ALE30406.1 CR1-alpha [Simian adenovirus 16]
MKICAAICVLSIISIAAARTLISSPVKGREIVYYTNSTALIQLVCACPNELILWHANGSLCKAFLNNQLFELRNPLCENCTAHSLILTPPFVTGPYTCIGSGVNDSCVKRWFIQAAPAPTVAETTLLATTSSSNYTSPNRFWLPYLGLVPVAVFALTLFI